MDQSWIPIPRSREPRLHQLLREAFKTYLGGLSIEEYELISKANPEIDYQSQLKAVQKVLSAVGLANGTSAKTHFFRHMSAKSADLQGAPDLQTVEVAVLFPGTKV